MTVCYQDSGLTSRLVWTKSGHELSDLIQEFDNDFVFAYIRSLSKAYLIQFLPSSADPLHITFAALHGKKLAKVVQFDLVFRRSREYRYRN